MVNHASRGGKEWRPAYSKLARLHLSQTGVIDGQMPYLAKIPRLQRLSLDQTDIASAGVEQLAKSKTIERLSLHDCKNLDSTCIRALQKMENLNSLEIKRSGIGRTTVSRRRKERPFLTIDWSK